MKNTQLEYQKVVNYIIEMVTSGNLIVGSKLPSERELSEKLLLGRNAAREAISILRGLGLVESRHGSGNYISNDCGKSIKAIVSAMLALGSITKYDVIEYRRGISFAVCSLLIEKGISDKDAENINRIMDSMDIADKRQFVNLDKEFHLGLIYATKNPLFETVMAPIGEIYLELVNDVIMETDDNQLKELALMRRDIFESIKSRNKEACKIAMTRHYDFAEKM